MTNQKLKLIMATEEGTKTLHTFETDVVSGTELLDVLRTCKAWDSYHCDTLSNHKVYDAKFTVGCMLRFDYVKEGDKHD